MIENDSQEIIEDIFLFDLSLMMRLEVFDDGGNRLPFMPNNLAKQILQPLAEGTGELNERIKHAIDHHGPPYLLWIKLSGKTSIAPNEFKLIQLKYRDTLEPKTANIFSTLASSSRHTITVNKPISENYDVFINITAPSGCTLTYSITEASADDDPLTENQGFYRTKLEDFLQIRIPGISKNVRCSVVYDIQPPKLEYRFVKLTLLGLAIVSSLLIVMVIDNGVFSSSNTNIINPNSYLQTNFSGLSSIYSKVFKNMFEISSLIAGGSVAIAGLVRNPLFARARIFYLGTFFTAILAFILH